MSLDRGDILQSDNHTDCLLSEDNVTIAKTITGISLTEIRSGLIIVLILLRNIFIYSLNPGH